MSGTEYLAGHFGGPRERHAALYIRVSTLAQRLDLQHDALAAYAERADLKVIATFADVAVSGRREGRPQLAALMQAARRRDIGYVLVWKSDRFVRSTRHLLEALAEFDHLGSVQDQIDTASPMGRAMFTIIGAMAELEAALISERVTAGMRAAKVRGRRLGRPPTPPALVREIEAIARTTALSVRAIHRHIDGRASRSRVGEIARRIRSG